MIVCGTGAVIGANIYAFNKHRIACNNLCNVLDKKYEAIEKIQEKREKDCGVYEESSTYKASQSKI